MRLKSRQQRKQTAAPSDSPSPSSFSSSGTSPLSSSINHKAALKRKRPFTMIDSGYVGQSKSKRQRRCTRIKLKIRRIEDYEMPIPHHQSRRNPMSCAYQFFNGYRIGIQPTIGSGKLLKSAIKIMSADLTGGRVKAAATQKNTFLVFVKTDYDTLIGCALVRIDSAWKKVNIDMFAVHEHWRHLGLASMMIYLIQVRMCHYLKFDLFVCAADTAIRFWSNPKFGFVAAHKGLLDETELFDEKHGKTKHLIWRGNETKATYGLLRLFIESEKRLANARCLEGECYSTCCNQLSEKMVYCTACDVWYHYECVGFNEKIAAKMKGKQYKCPQCSG